MRLHVRRGTALGAGVCGSVCFGLLAFGMVGNPLLLATALLMGGVGAGVGYAIARINPNYVLSILLGMFLACVGMGLAGWALAGLWLRFCFIVGVLAGGITGYVVAAKLYGEF